MLEQMKIFKMIRRIAALLSTVAERPKTFYLGHRDYDPVNVGYRHDELAGGFEFDTSIRGNHNTGHEFSNEKEAESSGAC